MRTREYIMQAVNKKLGEDASKYKKYLLLDNWANSYPNFTMGGATYVYKDDYELLDSIMLEVANPNNLPKLKKELSAFQLDCLLAEESLLVAAYNLLVIRTDRELADELVGILEIG